MKIFTGKNPNVKKIVFEFPDAIAESVLYQFEQRTVLCISVQSGCAVGCTFCGTGNKFIRNLTKDEIIHQVVSVFAHYNIIPNKINKLQIMFMSMGEPFHNYNNVKSAIISLNTLYPNAQLLVSTISPSNHKFLNDFISLSQDVYKIGLQFSIHESTDEKRNKLIPFKKKMNLLEIQEYGIRWWQATKRMPYCNYCINGTNNTQEDFENLKKLFPREIFCFTFSVVCSKEENGFSFRNMEEIREFEIKFLSEGYNTRIFDPAGQDDIGGGCGQLWFVQDYMKNKLSKK